MNRECCCAKTKKRTECDWVSRDEAEVDKFISDELCGYKYTVNGMKALFMTLKQVSSRRWYNSVPLSMPIFLLSGSMDPVGDYGKGVKEVYKTLKKTGHKNVTMKIYEDARHEIFNEINRDEVHADIITWLDERAEKFNQEKLKASYVESIDEPADFSKFE